MADYLLKTENLSKVFGKGSAQTYALNDISLHVETGDFIAITGPSGCGKSTLLSILGLLDNPTSGDYRLCNRNIRQLSNYQKSHLRNRSLGWIFQNFNLICDMTVLENVMLPLRYTKGISAAQMKKSAIECLQQVSIADKANSLPSELSGGQQQRVAIARAIVQHPDILLADEPTGSLDSENAEQIFQLLQKLNIGGMTILLVTHARELAERCNRIIRMKDGQLCDTEPMSVAPDHNSLYRA
ncbi:ABC transporter ATP-binding protein [Rheinheimera sp. D18]|uniref:ABC transporter ATP-binding protein n=1 Tax=Rheinheimera sp. D18 TaxID=2545632 RepID=UPI00105276F0|nr:ABC transporter ATP-binding protein [Rheinheimera sp. D18]QBL08017.1 ABC transporter ATP-binding protein [Rheinheimera sp. D18]